ncbi:TasA family protein [Rhodococcus sp. H36-A4]|uniref:TasA family protein n=1 Tax=Rhodococcus sp. H36-A4 TaxID=3004353 RepID=UPI0022AFB956|nr:TasA family protein [Rhodococcus sp. H36-A4]MCZ4080475.1 TasA family protein [Rhodococcus sp. H36-A4]
MARRSDGFKPSNALRRIGRALIGARGRAIMSIGIVLGLGAVGTLAAWSDTSVATSGEFKTGKIDIMLDGVDNNPTSISTGLTKAAMVPGDTVSASFVVQNQGSVVFTYTIGASMTDAPFGQLLKLEAYAGASCSGTALGTRAGLTTSAQPFIVSGTTPLTRPNVAAKVGATPGADPLCISVTMPSNATLPGTARTGTISLTFTATST